MPPTPTIKHDLLSQWSDANYWRKLCPYLTISETTGDASVGRGGDCNDNEDGLDEVLKDKMLQCLTDDGYALIDDEICDDELRENVRRGVSDLEVEHALPATFVLLFDETWKLAAKSHNLLLRSNNHNNDGKEDREEAGAAARKGGGILRENKMAFNFDMLAWHIDPRLNQSGFSPHRDRQPDSPGALERSFYADGRAKYVTHWIALTDATPENSCLYVIPREFDPGYSKGDDDADDDPRPTEEEGGGDDCNCNDNASDNKSRNGDKATISDPLTRALDTKQSYQNIRALPRRAGLSVVFTHRILHWGSRGNPRAMDVQPRIAISFVYSDVDFEAPYLSEESFSEQRGDGGDGDGEWSDGCRPPPFSIRLLLVCAQLLIYYQRFNLSTSTLRACYDYCKCRSTKLNDGYRKKVFVEYVKAMKERRDGAPDSTVDKSDMNQHCIDNEEIDDAANSEDEEALLEEMLNHSDEFDDDYDDMCHDGEQDGGSKKRKHSE
mmetsp:Transcript_38659/g.93083  ORF Transcript_38659/g.93083 Transcript_38659/m.93083 type:complete len:495 (-) Transcript_38659:59-1543(-)